MHSPLRPICTRVVHLSLEIVKCEPPLVSWVMPVAGRSRTVRLSCGRGQLHARLVRQNGTRSAMTCTQGSQLTHALSRVAFDLLVYVHARAVELKHDDEIDAMLELHSSDQTLVGRALRGCGVVVCEKGREAFARAVALVREAMITREGE